MAYLHGSRAAGRYRAGSDIDIAAYFCGRSPQSLGVLLPAGVDLLVLDDAPLELAGRVAVGGRLLFEDDQVARVRWEAMTRKIYFDELPRIARREVGLVRDRKAGKQRLYGLDARGLRPVHLFEGVDAGRVALEPVRAEPTQRVTHLTYAVRER